MVVKLPPLPTLADLTRLRAHDGPMTRELLLRPGQHGLGMTHAAMDATATVTMPCGYCSTGCGLRMHLDEDGRAVGLTPETSYPVNLGMACPKGWEALRVLESDDRATHPKLRDSSGTLQTVSWDTALQTFVDRFKDILHRHGPESVAFLSTGQIACEEMAFLGSLAKFGMGLIHGDGNTRQCMATAVTAYKQSFGFDAPPYTYADFEASDVLVFVGANPCIGHPIMWERVLRNPNDPAIIAIDPRRTETAMAAKHHLAVRPKGDLKLLYAIAHAVIELGALDEEFINHSTTGFDELRHRMRDFAPESVAAEVGVSAAQIRTVAAAIAGGQAVSFWWTMGVNQSYEGTRVAQAIINLALMTGNIGRPGTGANSITGQCNAMGSRLWSNTTNLLGHRQFESENDRREVADSLGVDPACIPTQPSKPYHQIVHGIREGSIKGLWVIATNPAHSWIDQNALRQTLGGLDFLVVQDMYDNTETALSADLQLPAAAWGEKEGTLINSERRYGRLRAVRKAPGEALSDFRIFQAIAHYWGVGEMFAEWTNPESVFRMMQKLSAGRPCDITGIEGYDHLDRAGGIQWPYRPDPSAQTASTGGDDEATDGEPASATIDDATERRLFSDGKFYHDDGRAKFIVDAPQEPPEQPDADYPLWLLTGRGTVSQWHTQTRTSKSPILRTLYPNRPYLELHPSDASGLDIRHGQTVTVKSRRGQVQVTASITPSVAPGMVFMPMHYEEANRLTLSHFDPHSGQPSYKDCAVRITTSETDLHLNHSSADQPAAAPIGSS